MAKKQTSAGSLQEGLECSVCFHVYDLEKRIPKALPCLHTVCAACVENIKSGLPTIKCPICKKATYLRNIITNFGLRDVVEKVCQSCGSREKDDKCLHCDKDVCSVCAGEHAKLFHTQVTSELQMLRQKIKEATVQSLDDSVYEKERKKGDESIRNIKISMEYHLSEYNKLGNKLTMEIKKLRSANIEQQRRWARQCDYKLDLCKPFLGESEDKIGMEYSADCLVTEIYRIHTDTVKLLSELQDLQQSIPDPVEYKFVAAKSAKINLGKIATRKAARESQLPTSIRYKHARSKAMTGSEGSGAEQFAGQGYVTCMGNIYIASDMDNHRLKVYDRDLNLMFILGGKGDQDQQFNYPDDLCISPAGELFVSDCGNHQIKVYDRYLQLVRSFGSEGSGDNQFIGPSGLAFTSAGEMVVCDLGNHRLKVHRPDGTYLRSIGRQGQCPGQFSNYPCTVAVTPGDCVLVAVLRAQHLQMFTITGDYVRTIAPSVPNSPAAIVIRAITVDQEGNIIIADEDNERLIVLDDEGRFVCTIGSRMDQPGELSGPWSVAVNHNGDIAVYEMGNNRIQVFET